MGKRWDAWKAKHWGLSERTDLPDLSMWEGGSRLEYPRWRRAVRRWRAWLAEHPYAASMWLLTAIGVVAAFKDWLR